MRNLVVYEALNQLALEASESLAGLVASGAEIPFEVEEEPGPDAPLYRYEPLTEAFISAEVASIRELPSFGPALAAIESSGVVVPYLTALDVVRPADPRRQAEEAIVSFLGRLWVGSTDFSLEGSRFEAAIRELESVSSDDPGGIEVVVPLVGLQMPMDRLDLPGGVALVRSDTVEVPAEARRPEGQATTPWEPQILATVRRPEAGGGLPAPVTAGRLALGALVTTLRLFKAGNVGLGPLAWTRAGEGPWRRLATGAGRSRGGGYWLTEAEGHELSAFAAAVAARPLRGGALAWSIGRFEMGVERAPLDGMSDHLLALRALLEGGGPAAIGLAARVAALCVEPEHRRLVQAQIDRAFAVEQMLMRGFAVDLEDGGGDLADGLAADIEDHLRAILRDAVSGHLGTELRATADEILMADGLSVDSVGELAEEQDEVRISRIGLEPEKVVEEEGEEADDWMAETSGYHDHTLEWPVREPVVAVNGEEELREGGPRRHLFPVPDATEWEVPEPPGRATRSGARPTTSVTEAAEDPDPAPADEEHEWFPRERSATRDQDVESDAESDAEWDDYSAPV